MIGDPKFDAKIRASEAYEAVLDLLLKIKGWEKQIADTNTLLQTYDANTRALARLDLFARSIMSH